MGGDTLVERAVVSRRIDALRALGATEVTRVDLTSALGCSRSTVDRALGELEAAGLVAATDGGFVRTATGSVAVRSYERVERALDRLFELSPALEGVEDAPIPLSLLRRGRLVPDAAVSDPLSRWIPAEASRTRVGVLAPAVADWDVDALREGIERGCRLRLVTTRAGVKHLVGAGRNALEAICAAEAAELAVVDSLPFGLTVVRSPSGGVVILRFVDERTVSKAVKCDDPWAVGWACDYFRTVFESADALPTPADAD